MPRSTTDTVAPLRVSVVHPEDDARAQWCLALSACLPAARVQAWTATPGTAQGPGHTPPQAGGEDGLHVGVGWKPPAEYFAAHPDLAAFFVAGAGVDHLLALAELPPRLPVIRLEDAGMAEQMFLYCLHEILRRLHRSDDYEDQQRAGRWRELPARAPTELRVGVFGLGALGGDVARRLAALGFRVSGFARAPHRIHGVDCRHGADQWPGFLGACDVLVLMAPLTGQTRGIIDARALAALPTGAWLVNVARGALIDEAALLAALAQGTLGGATLDVFEHEPLAPAHPFWRHPRIRLTPHVAAQTLIAPSARQVADKILRLQQGESVSGIVHRERGY